jgi:hypothetical protein
MKEHHYYLKNNKVYIDTIIYFEYLNNDKKKITSLESTYKLID